jgi:hypothetical protein
MAVSDVALSRLQRVDTKLSWLAFPWYIRSHTTANLSSTNYAPAAPRTLERHAAKWHRLYEQQPQKTAPSGAAVLGANVLCWNRWCTAGLDGLLDDLACDGTAAALCQGQTCPGQPQQGQSVWLGDRAGLGPHRKHVSTVH